MAFSVSARVKVVDDSSQWRGCMGVVKSVSGNNHQVRLDGFQNNRTVLLTTGQLLSSTQPVPIEY